MFPLAGKDFPKTAEELSAAIEDALREVFTLPKKGAGVTVEGEFPKIDLIRINLDGAKVSTTEPPPKPEAVGKRQPGITLGRLEISGHPIQYEKSKLDLDVSASGLKLDFGKDKSGRPLLVLTDAEDGEVEAEITKDDIEAVLLSAGTIAAKQQGVTLQELELELTSRGERSVAVAARVKAKKFMVSGVLNVAGAVEIDEALNATPTGLSCTGEGIIGSTAAGFVQKYIKEYEGKPIPLMAFSLGDVTLRDLEIEVNGSLRVSAAFGKQGKGVKAAKASKGCKGKGKAKRG